MEASALQKANGGAVSGMDRPEEEGTLIEPSVMSAEVRAEVDMQITTARRYPRSLAKFNRDALEMATFDEEIAAGCFYSLPRQGKAIEGPSIRLAEIVISAWGNLRSEARVVRVDEKEVTAEAMTWDLEKNTAVRIQVKRRITDTNGRRYNDDMITVTGNAACAIALRNSVFKVIPMVYTKSLYRAARACAIGDIKTLANKRAEMLEYFAKMGVTEDRIFASIGKPSIEEIGLEELAMLKGAATAIKDGDLNIDDAFPAITIATDGPAGLNGLKGRLAKSKEVRPTEEPVKPAEPDVTSDAKIEPDAVAKPESEVSETVSETNPRPADTDVEAERAAIEAESDPLETLRANVTAKLDELTKSQRKEILVGKPFVSEMSSDELNQILIDARKIA
ncbi:MAG: hypothetical protein ABI878_13910 [Acidobacteriota bacterium]